MINNLDAVTIVVEDQQRALEFYRDALGFVFRNDDVMGAGMRFLMVAPPQGQTGIVLYPAGQEAPAGGTFGTIVATDDCAATHAQLAARGVRFSEAPTQQEWGGIQAQFADQDGNHFVLIELPEHMKGGLKA